MESMPKRHNSQLMSLSVATARRSRAPFLVIPAEICVITQFARLDQVRDGEEGTEYDADTADDDICDPEKGILGTHNGTRGDDDGLGATIGSRIEICFCQYLVQNGRHVTYGG